VETEAGLITMVVDLQPSQVFLHFQVWEVIAKLLALLSRCSIGNVSWANLAMRLFHLVVQHLNGNRKELSHHSPNGKQADTTSSRFNLRTMLRQCRAIIHIKFPQVMSKVSTSSLGNMDSINSLRTRQHRLVNMAMQGLSNSKEKDKDKEHTKEVTRDRHHDLMVNMEALGIDR